MATEIDPVNTGSGARCVIIAGAPGADASFVAHAVRGGDCIMCADRGFDVAAEAGLTPDYIIGDFDSCKRELPRGGAVIRLSPEKDDTDTVHCITTALRMGFRRFVLLAAVGGRLDHTLGNLCALELLADSGAEGAILSERETIRLLRGGSHRVDGCRGKTFSVLPFGCRAAVLTYEGAYYPLQNGTLTHADPVGVSNVFTADNARITVHSGQILLIIEEMPV